MPLGAESEELGPTVSHYQTKCSNRFGCRHPLAATGLLALCLAKSNQTIISYRLDYPVLEKKGGFFVKTVQDVER